MRGKKRLGKARERTTVKIPVQKFSRQCLVVQRKPYDPAHVPDNTQPINLRTHPNQTYTKDFSDDKNPKFIFGTQKNSGDTREKASSAAIPSKSPLAPDFIVADGGNDNFGTANASSYGKKEPDVHREGKTKRLKSRSERDSKNTSFANPMLSNKPSNPGGAIPKRVNRHDSTDSSSSSGGYAPGLLQVLPLTRENSTTSTDDAITSDAPDYAAVNPPSNKIGVSHLPVNEDVARAGGNGILDALKEEPNAPKVIHDKTPIGSNMETLVPDESISPIARNENNNAPVTTSQSDSGIVRNRSSTEKLSGRLCSRK